MSNIREYFRLPSVHGEIGIEIEMEGDNLPGGLSDSDSSDIKGWMVDQDGSCRGENKEYVLRMPVPRDEVVGSLAVLKQAFEEQGSLLTPSDRCGVHIHINCQKMKATELYRFIGLYLIFEDVLVNYCGEDRIGNLFCLRAQDAESLVVDMFEVIQEHLTLRRLSQKNMRYSSINLMALGKFGSLEFRSLKTMRNIAEIATWVELLLCVRDASLKYDSIRSMVEGISFNGTRNVLDSIFGDKAELLVCPNLDRMIMAGVRRVQQLAYTDGVMHLTKDYREYARKMQAEREEVAKVKNKANLAKARKFLNGEIPLALQAHANFIANPFRGFPVGDAPDVIEIVDDVDPIDWDGEL